MNKAFFGVHVPTITPYGEDGQVSEELIRVLAEFYINAGVRCLVPTANNGEQPLLDAEEKKRVWRTTIDAAAGRVCVAPSVTGNTTREVMALAKFAESIGADGVMVAPPYYFKASEDELFDHYRAIAGSINIPLMIHNEPGVFKSDVTPTLVAKLNQIDNISMIKESADDTQRVHEIIRLCGDSMTVVIAGGGIALESFLLGARAWMTGLVNFIPETAVAVYRLAAEERNFDAARERYFAKILPVHSCMKAIGKPVPTVKFALSLVLGRAVGEARLPLSPLSPAEQLKVKDVLTGIGVLGE